MLFIHEFQIGPPRWSKALNGLRVAVVSDIHAGGLWIDQNKLRQIVELTNSAHPDLILLAGDYINNTRGGGCSMSPQTFCAELGRMHAPLGTYAVLGNHDWAYNGIEVTTAFRKAGITVLENNSAALSFHSQQFWLIGIEDLGTRHPDVLHALKTAPSDAQILVLTHDPNLFPAISPRVNLTIAGHTHGGQVWLPLLHIFAPKMGCQEPYVKDVVVQKNGMLFISIGIGNSVFPIRFLNAPEISVLNLSAPR